MKATIEIKFKKIGMHKVNKILFKKEPKLNDSVRKFMELLANALIKDFFKKQGIRAGEIGYIIKQKGNNLTGFLTFEIEKVQGLDPNKLGMGYKVTVDAFQKDLDLITEKLEYHYLTQSIETKIKGEVE